MRRVLYVAHNHSGAQHGGSEVYADTLRRALDSTGEWETMLVARHGPPYADDRVRWRARFSRSDTDPRMFFMHTHSGEYDPLLVAGTNKRLYTESWRSLLRELRPDVVHLHHSTLIGYDLLRETRLAMPEIPILYTLHDFHSICRNRGEMVRTFGGLCDHASPRRCHACFPDIPPRRFFLRERFVKSALAHVDTFIAPSKHLRRRYVEWGIPAEKIVHERCGLEHQDPLPEPPDAGRRRRIGFFGRITETKGITVLLEAMEILQSTDAGVTLTVHGSGLELNRASFQERVRELLDATAGSVRVRGGYGQAELPELLADVDWVVVPSTWWEIGPLVAAEAMAHRRPVICSDIGGMAELVSDGVSGLHFRTGDPGALAATIRRAVEEPGLWDQLRNGIAPPHSIEDHLEVITGLYERLIEARRPTRSVQA